MIKAVLFDLDGTLLDRDASVRTFIAKQYDRFIESMGHVSKERYISRFIELDCRGYVWKDEVYQQLVEEFAINDLTSEQLLEDYLANFQYSCIPFPNLIKVLEILKSKSTTLGMITNGRGQFQLDNIRVLGIEEYFDAIFISEWEQLKKPDPKLFERMLERLELSASECVFVGDHPDNDVKAARNVGMIGIWKKDFQWQNVKADYTINDLEELPKLLEEIICN